MMKHNPKPKRKLKSRALPSRPQLQQLNNTHEQERLEALLVFEREARQEGFTIIAGVDEAGRGPLAGPVVAAACIVPDGLFLSGINDSKKLTPLQRQRLFADLTQDSRIDYGVGVVSHQDIDRINILQATIQAMQEAVGELSKVPDFLLVDGLKLPHSIPSLKIIKGDSRSYSIAAASIIAKETRDQIMVSHHKKWPQYGFQQHKGYGTQKHRDALDEHGPCPIHRLTFEPVKSMVEVL